MNLQAKAKLFAPCPRGLESTLATELAELGASAVQSVAGGVAFEGDTGVIYRANLESRIATRVLLRLFTVPYRSEEDIYRATHEVDWPQQFDVARSIRVYLTAQRCPLKSLDFLTLRIKDAVCDRFRSDVGSRPNVDTRAPEVRIHAFLDATQFTLYLDTSSLERQVDTLRSITSMILVALLVAGGMIGGALASSSLHQAGATQAANLAEWVFFASVGLAVVLVLVFLARMVRDLRKRGG